MKEAWQLAVDRMPLCAWRKWSASHGLNLITGIVRMPSQYLMVSILIAACLS